MVYKAPAAQVAGALFWQGKDDLKLEEVSLPITLCWSSDDILLLSYSNALSGNHD